MSLSAPRRAHQKPLADLPLAARRHGLVSTVEHALRRRCDFPMQGKLILGVSGGPDSLAMLIACTVIRDRGKDAGAAFEPIVVYVHHHLRDSADGDAEAVSDLCERLRVPCEIAHVHPVEMPGNVSANARQLRYEALESAARAHGARHVAAAHHAEDQLETMIASLCRGGGIAALAAMRWARPLGDSISLIRPLLGASKNDCIDLCQAAGVQWREDPSNEDVSFARARLRQDVLPVLEELWPGCAARAQATSELLAAAADALEERLNGIFGSASQTSWSRSALAAHSTSLIAAGMYRAATFAVAESGNDLLQRQLLAAADAVRDDVRAPRVFAIGRSHALRVTAREVVLERA